MTKGIQFVHEGAFAVQGSRKTPTRFGKTTGRAKASARKIIGEAIREAPKYHLHVVAPKPAVCLYGKQPADLVGSYAELVAAAAANFEELRRVGGGIYLRSQKSTTKILIGTVFSYPGPPDEADADYVKWRMYVTAWSRRWYGKSCVSILEYLDEPHGHIHALAYAQGGLGKPVAQWQVGEGAAIAVRQNGGNRKAQGQAYKLGCQNFLDAFWRQVGRKCRLDRISATPKPRMQYAVAKAMSEWQRIQADEESAMQTRRRKFEELDAAAETELAIAKVRQLAKFTTDNAGLVERERLFELEKTRFVDQVQRPFLAYMQAVKATLSDATNDAISKIARKFGYKR